MGVPGRLGSRSVYDNIRGLLEESILVSAYEPSSARDARVWLRSWLG